MRTFLFLCLLSIGLTACAPQAQEPAVDVAAEAAAVQAVSMRWLELAKVDDYAGIAALFTSSGATFSLNEEPVVGPAAIQAAMEADSAQSGEPNWATDSVLVAASGDVAVEYGSWFGMGAEGDARGKYITVYRKMAGEWKVASDMVTSTVPEAEDEDEDED